MKATLRYNGFHGSGAIEGVEIENWNDMLVLVSPADDARVRQAVNEYCQVSGCKCGGPTGVETTSPRILWHRSAITIEEVANNAG